MRKATCALREALISTHISDVSAIPSSLTNAACRGRTQRTLCSVGLVVVASAIARQKPNEMANCSKWWKADLRLLKPKAVVLLGKPAADAFAHACGLAGDFASMLEAQGQTTVFGGLVIPFSTVPHPTAPYRGLRGGRGEYYELAFSALRNHLSKQRQEQGT